MRRNMIPTGFLLAVTFLLAGCTLPQPSSGIPPPSPSSPPEERAEAGSSEQRSPALILSGSGGVREHLLPTSILELGEATAPVTLLVFTEPHCRYCRDFERTMLPGLTEDFVKQGRLKIDIVIFPLQKYEYSKESAAALLCAAMEGKGLPMHGLLFRGFTKARPTPAAYAEDAGLDPKKFKSCMEDGSTAVILAQHASLARSLAVSLVPTFFLSGEKTIGLPDEADLRGMIGEKLREAH
ncbi:MAG: DsbA family protein [Candidatus Peregrinibacteria bacterium]